MLNGNEEILLYSPAAFLALSKSAKDAICNGCGAANAKFDFIPDNIYGLSIKRACDRHDYMYHVGITLIDKEEADRVFFNNMLRLIEAGSPWLKMLRRRRALKYYEFVVAFGGPAYWKNKNKPEEESKL